MAQSLNDIMQELDAGYNPSRDLINQQISALPSQSEAQIAGLKAQEDQSYNDITDQARARGMGFSGIPLGDQAKYNATTFLPAVANVYSSQNQNKNSLLGALASLQEDQVKTANSIEGQQQQNDIAQQQADAAARAAGVANGSIGGLLSGGGGAAASTAPGKAAVQQRKDGGFNFQDSGGKAISAARYSQLTGVPIRTLLQTMANAGDAGAKQALGLVGNDYGYNRSKVTSQNQINLLRALGLTADNYVAPKAAQAAPAAQSYPGNYVAPRNLSVLMR